jgi:hypothetical protein
MLVYIILRVDSNREEKTENNFYLIETKTPALSCWGQSLS